MTFAARFTAARVASGLSQEALGKIVGLTQQAIQAIENGTTAQPRKIKQIALALGTTPEALLFGTGAAEPAAPYNVSDAKYAMIPRYEIAGSMGNGHENSHEEISGSHAYRRDWLEREKPLPAACVVIDAVGESMQPTIGDGDVVLINTLEKKISNGQVYAFNTEDGVRIKRLFRQLDGRVRVASDNPDKITYPDEWLTPGMDVAIIGRVVHRSGGV